MKITPLDSMARALGLTLRGAAVLAACVLLVGRTRAATPADPKASPEARHVLEFLASLPGKKDNKVIAGQLHQDYCRTIHQETGKWVGLMGASMINGASAWPGAANAVTIRQQYFDWWQAGGLVTENFKIHNPKTKGVEKDRDFTDADMDAAITPGNPINANLNAYLDTWAEHDRWLADHHVPLIIRPLHEGNRYFWHGARDPAKYKALWNYIFGYLTSTKGLHNLLFAYSPAAYDPAKRWVDYYPGDARVDVVGIDRYTDLTGDVMLTEADFEGYRALEPLGKPIALGEFGPHNANSSRPLLGKADYRKLIAGIKTYAPNIVFWFSWSVRWSMRAEDNDHVADLLNDPWVVTRDEIPNLK